MAKRAETRERTETGEHRVVGVGVGSQVPPLVSVLVPAFNHERFITQCLDSILADGYPNLEVVIVDDGSPDTTPQVAQAWIGQHGWRFAGGVLLLQQENRGLVKTLNRLVSKARGEFITVLASDDCLYPGSIGARVDYLLANPRYLAVFGDAAGIDENEAVLVDSVLDDRYSASRKALRCDATRGMELILNWSVPGPVYLARRQVTHAIGGYDERYCFEDRNYYLRLIQADALGFIDRRVALYRMCDKPPASRFSQFQRDWKKVHEDLLTEVHGFNRFALRILVALQSNCLRHREYPAISTSLRILLLQCLRKGILHCNRGVAVLLAASQGLP